MNAIDQLKKELTQQDYDKDQPYAEMLGKYKDIACSYARMENAIAVLSDLRTNTSYVYYGNFAKTLGIDKSLKEVRVSSILEEEIFKLVHPDDLSNKHLQELCFSHFLKRQPKKNRADYYLISKLRMKNGINSYIPVLHRIFYITVLPNCNLWLALCLYSPLLFDIPAKSLIVNSTNGQMIELDKQNGKRILSDRERQVLILIDRGFTSKEIAGTLSISVNTVSRHRQEILSKLQVKNSIEACRVAKDLKLI